VVTPCRGIFPTWIRALYNRETSDTVARGHTLVKDVAGVERRTGERRRALTLLAAMLGIIVVSVAGCTYRPNDSNAENAATFEASAEAVVGSPADSAVGVRASGCSLVDALGSGAVLAQPGLVVTSAHTVAGSNRIEVVDVGNQTHRATLVLFDPDSDLALLDVPTLTAPPLLLGSAAVNDNAVAHTWSPHDGFTANDVVVERLLRVTIEDIYIEDEVRRTAFEFRGPIGKGDSGAAVTVNGRIAGVVYAQIRGENQVGFALDRAELDDALDELDELAAKGRTPVDSGRCTP